MTWWDDLFKSPARRKAEQDKKRRQALTKAKTALRRERRSIAKRQNKGEELRRKAVEYERQGKQALAKQTVKHLVQVDKEAMARTMALNNMEQTLEQVQMKDNYEDFVRGMKIVADIEELAQQSSDPDEVRERLTDLAQRNQDLVEPWTETVGIETAATPAAANLTDEEREIYDQVVTDATGQLESAGDGSEFAEMDQELERKMNEALGKE